jgi:hypothetical protein
MKQNGRHERVFVLLHGQIRRVTAHALSRLCEIPVLPKQEVSEVYELWTTVSSVKDRQPSQGRPSK